MLQQDFVGFTYNGHHSSEYGIFHVSDGSRYKDNLLPSRQDKTAQVPGGNGTYYFGSYYTSRVFDLQIAYGDDTNKVTEQKLRQMRSWLGTPGIHELVFDEEPYKTYYVKNTGMPQFQYICFDERANNDLGYERVYKGEANVQFTAFDPFAHCVEGKKFKEYWLASTTITIPNTDPVQTITTRNFPNAEEWLPSAGLVSSTLNYDVPGATINLYNPGDVETDFCLYINKNNVSNDFTVENGDNILSVNGFTPTDQNETMIRINSKNHLIEGGTGNSVSEFVLSGNIYNQYISSGDFFKIPVGASTLTAPIATIQYDYLYY